MGFNWNYLSIYFCESLHIIITTLKELFSKKVSYSTKEKRHEINTQKMKGYFKMNNDTGSFIVSSLFS